MPFGPVDPASTSSRSRTRVLDRWRAERHPRPRSRELRKDGEPWIFYEGPPTANGRPGLHHVWARVFKDLYPRFQTMRGRRVPRKGGWDCHGLPVELEVEKELGLHSKHEIEAYGIAEFNQRCRDSVHALRRGLVGAHRALRRLDRHRGRVLDADQRLHRVGLVAAPADVGQAACSTRATGSRPTAPAAARRSRRTRSRRATATSSIPRSTCASRSPTVRTPRRRRPARVDDDAVDARLQRRRGRRPRHRLRAHRRPGRRRATSCWRRRPASRRYPEAPRSLAACTGAELVGGRYQPPVRRAPARRRRPAGRRRRLRQHRRRLGHRAPRAGLRRGRRRSSAGPRACRCSTRSTPTAPSTTRVAAVHGPVREGRRPRPIIDDLAARGLLVAEEPYEHSYPHCWRCGTPLIYWAKTVVVRPHVRAARPSCSRENERIGWHPEHIKHGRFGKWLEGNVDWALSRDRYWGTPLPIWRCARVRPRHLHRLGGRARGAWPGRTSPSSTCTARTSTTSPSACPVDGCAGTARRLALRCSTPGSTRARCRPRSTTTPSRAPTRSTRRSRPTSSARPSTRPAAGSTRCSRSTRSCSTPRPYRNVVCLGHIVDDDGPEDVEVTRQRHRPVGDLRPPSGADALRWYFFSAGQPWTPRRVSRGRASARPPARRCSPSGTSSPSSPPTPTSTAGRRRPATLAAHPRARPLGAGRARRHRSPRSPTALEDFDALRRRHAASPASSTTSRTGTCAAAGPGSGRAATRPRTPRSTSASSPPPSCSRRSARSSPTSCTRSSPASRRCTWPTGPSRRGRADATASAARWRPPARLVALGRAARTDAKMKVRQPLRAGAAAAPGRRARRRRCGPRSRPSSTSRRSRTSTRCRA